MHRIALCTLLLVATTSCDRERPTPKGGESETTAPAASAESRPTQSPKDAPPPPAATAEDLPETIGQVALPVGKPWETQKAAGKSSTIVAADAGQQVCLEKVFEAHDRVMVRTSADCRPAADATYRLLGLDGKELSSFERYQSFSEPLATLLAQRDGKPVFVSLTDGTSTAAPAPSGSERFVFVQNRPEVMAFGHPAAAPEKYGFAIVDGVPKEPVATDRIEARVPDTGSLRFDEARELYIYRDIQTDCFRAALTPSGEAPAYCEARILRGRMTGKRALWTDHWLVLGDPKGQDNLALNIYTKREIDPTDGLCERPVTLPVDDALDVPRMLIGCPASDGNGMQLHLWTPEKTYVVPGGGYRPGAAHGDYVVVSQGETEQWLDLRRVELRSPDGLSLVAPGVAVRRDGDKHEVFSVRESTARSIGTVTCPGTLELSRTADEVIVGVCGVKGVPVDADGCRSARPGLRVDASFVWDLTKGRKHTLDAPVVAVTSSALVTAKSKFVQGGRTCRAEALAQVAR